MIAFHERSQMRRPRLSLLLAIGMLAALLPIGAAAPVLATTGDLVISGVVDGPLTGGVPKAVELYVAGDIADLSLYGIGSANNGGGSDGEEFTLPGVSASAGDYIYIASEGTEFTNFFGFAPDYTSGAANINGDDAIELFLSGVVVDVFGDINVDGTGEPWEHLDGWAHRVPGTGQDGSTFVLANWTFSGPNALDGETTNATATTPFPIGRVIAPTVLINEVDADTAGTDVLEFVELFDGGVGNTALDGLVVVFYNGSDDASYDSFDLDGLTTDADGYFVLGNAAVAGVDVIFGSNGLQNGADAVALHTGDAVDFPNDTPVTTTDLLDAVVYDTNDGDDAGLLVLLNASQVQLNEDANGDKDAHSNQRCPNGSGDARDTDTFDQFEPTPGAENTCSIPPPPPPPVEITLIHDVQGAGAVSPLDGTVVAVQGVVTAEFNGTDEIGGFVVQEEDGDVDANPATSEGIYVFSFESVTVGEIVTVTGTVDEFFGLTELTGSVEVVHETALTGAASATALSLPVASVDNFEAVEGMLVEAAAGLVVTEVFNLGRFGTVSLSGQRLPNPTQVAAPGAAANAQQAANDLNRVDLDDRSSVQNPDIVPYVHDGTLRGGEIASGFTAVMFFSFGNWTLQPVTVPSFSGGDRPAEPPSVGGDLQIATFNVLNYFNGDGTGTGFDSSEQRGADNLDEFNRQRVKIIAAIAALDADVVGLMEIENDGFGPLSSIVDLVNGLNDAVGAGTYAFINPGGAGVGDDAIAVGLLYKPAMVTPSGAAAIFDSSDDPEFNDEKNRAVLTQTFEDANGSAFTVAVNHFKSKGSSCADEPESDPDIGDGQGNCNLTRTAAANALASWLGTDPTSSGSDDFFIIGDLNAYAMEDPIAALETAGYVNTVEAFGPQPTYSFVFDGQWGTLDYVMASPGANAAVTGAAVWHINADEPRILDYNTEFNQDIQGLYVNDEFRASDHDAVVIGYSPDGTPPVVTADLDRIWASRRVGKFIVDYSCVDAVDSTPSCIGDINGLVVEDGQSVVLIKARGREWSRTIRGTLFIKARSFVLTVVGSDAAGNSAVETASPTFRGRWWR